MISKILEELIKEFIEQEYKTIYANKSNESHEEDDVPSSFLFPSSSFIFSICSFFLSPFLKCFEILKYVPKMFAYTKLNK